jgi:quercetin dioxygenase-like cupin family protein
MPVEPRLVTNRSAAPVEMGPGLVRRALACGERMLLVEVEVARGSVVPQHAHPHEQVGYVASGKIEFTLGDADSPIDRMLLSAGDGYTIPGGLPHSVVGVEDAVVVDVFSPVREEYR